MTGFLAAPSYSPLLTLAVGLITFVGCLGCGLGLLGGAGLDLPSPWRQAVGVVLGVLVLSLLVQVVGLAGLASRPILVLLWLAFVLFGCWGAARRGRPLLPARRPSFDRGALLAGGLALAALALNLLVAMAPSTKHDELYYHMLVPSRLVADGRLRFYLEPFEASFLPQMSYQIASAPLHALGAPDGANLLSWALALTLAWFAWFLLVEQGAPALRQAQDERGWALLAAGCLAVGLHPVVWTVTAGSHSLGELATTVALVALATRAQLVARVGPNGFAFTVSLLALAAFLSKVSLAPLSLGLLVWAGLLARPRPATPGCLVRFAGALVLPWVCFGLPLAAWLLGQLALGSLPLGDGSTLDLPTYLERLGRFSAGTLALNRAALPEVAAQTARDFSPPVWLGAAGVVVAPGLSGATKLALLSILALQLSAIALWLPYDPRFLGGIQYGLFLVFALCVGKALAGARRRAVVIVGTSLLLVLPWLVGQAYYARQFLPVVLGLQEPASFYRERVGLFTDYEALDPILPASAGLLTRGARSSAFYAPRRVYLDARDVPSDVELYLVRIGRVGLPTETDLPPGFAPGDQVYSNDRAMVYAFRTPGREPQVAPLTVSALKRTSETR